MNALGSDVGVEAAAISNPPEPIGNDGSKYG